MATQKPSVTRFGWMVVLSLAAARIHAEAPTDTPEPTQHEFMVKDFKTESGTVLPEARVVYGTYGQLNAAHDNVILLPSHYMADLHGYGWLIGPGKSLDPGKYFLVTSELFGNGIPSLWGHPAGAAVTPADSQFLNDHIAGFMDRHVN